ncbi:hypothetical protein [Thalassotalea sp. ND16A]|uniref:hypothetical protein n=1 Tax=Thalassotalea sp. ND16A TaxID=1535422 RepID=UPI00051DA8F8|nr:hypothetical protein [Thalassotalea sp. ND16A]KGJ97178.1 hypothetical protein ND16A_0100 [Thalassotalea sp. ND16A]
MALLIILAAVFGGVGLMVFFGERYGKPLEQKDQQQYSKILVVLVFVLLIAAIVRELL